MAGKLDLSIWNLTLVAASACGPLIPAEDGGDNTIGEDDSGDESGDESDTGVTTIDPCVGDDCPECQVDSDCPPGYYCDGQECFYEYTCGLLPGVDGFRCSPWYECYDDSWCSDGEVCIANYCEPIPCESSGFQSVYPIAVPNVPVVELVFADIDAQGPDEIVIATTARVDVAPMGDFPGVAVGEDLAALAMADVDGDGDNDLVAGDRGQGGQLFVLTNDGAGSFSVGAPIPTLGAVRDVVLADPENDGAVDAFVRTDDAIVRHADLGGPSLLVQLGSSAMTIAGWSMAYSTDATFWQPVATPELPPPTQLTAVVMNAFAPASLDFGTDPDVVGLRVDGFDTQVHYWAGPIADYIGVATLDGIYPVLVAADVYGDGTDEAIVAGEGRAIVLSGGVDSTCQGELLIDGLATPTSIAAGQIDTDEGEEVVISDGQQILLLDDVDLGG